MRKSAKSVHKAVQAGLFSEDKAAEVVNQGSVKVEVKVQLLVDKKGNGMFEFFASVPVIKRGKLVSPVASAEVGVEWVGPLLPTQARADMMRVA